MRFVVDSALRGERMAREGARFLVAGAVNTAATMALFWAVLPHTEYALAYTIAYVVGIALSYALNTLLVFKVKPSARTAAMYPLVYAFQYLFGLLVLWIWADVLMLPVQYGIVAVVILSIPLTFLLSRRILRS